MSFENPYAAPQFPGDGPPPGALSGGPGQPWTPSEVMGIGWNIFKEHWVVLFFAPLIAGFIQQIPSQMAQVAVTAAQLHPESTEALLITAIATILGSVLQIFFTVGETRLYLQAARGETPQFGVVFSGMDRFLPVFGTSILVGLAVILGLLALIVPGIILSYGLYFAVYVCVDERRGPVESITRSWAITDGHKANLFVLMLLAIPVLLVGLLACCVGVVAAASVVSVATAIVYLRITGQPARAY